ncbi:MAG: PepSY domain-containing protein [Chitinophagaceae bacterium]
MTISVWRYSHLALAVSSFIFIALAALTGIILSAEPVSQKFPSYRADDFNRISVAQVLPLLNKNFTEVNEFSVDANQFVTVKGADSTGKPVSAYVDPATGALLGVPAKQNEFFQWVTALHRSLFLHALGRFFVGLTAFLLMLITVSGAILVIQRQRGVKRFFTRIVKDNFAQYYHVVLGRFSLIPIFIIAVSGTWLSLARFDLFPERKITHKINFDDLQSGPKKKPADFAVFKNLLLPEIQHIQFPFADDPEEYYLLKLKNREIAISQFTGETLSEVKYPVTALVTRLSLDLHTGRGSIIWAIVLAMASANMLFFIYSGFVIMRKRTSTRIKNKHKAHESRFIILVGSENGSTLQFANVLQQQLIGSGHAAFLTELNNYTVFPKAEHIIVLTATYGLGNPPSDASKFSALVKKYKQSQRVHFSVVGFGSHAYPDFCRFAFDTDNLLSKEDWAMPLLEIHTVEDKSPEQFSSWFSTWAQKVNLPQLVLPASFSNKPSGLQALEVIEKTSVAEADGTFIMRLQPGRWARFTSGDLLAIYPADDYRERLYSIGRIKREIQLSVRLHADGLGSGYLYKLAPGNTVLARIIANEHFQFPQKAPAVIMICNGTGIAPFLGMIDQNSKKIDCHLYGGFRNQSSFELYREPLEKNKKMEKLYQLHIAYSRDGDKQYVSDLINRDAAFIARTLMNKGVLMICGSLSMHNDVIALLEIICQERTGNNISFYQSHGQVLSDCY